MDKRAATAATRWLGIIIAIVCALILTIWFISFHPIAGLIIILIIAAASVWIMTYYLEK